MSELFNFIYKKIVLRNIASDKRLEPIKKLKDTLSIGFNEVKDCMQTLPAAIIAGLAEEEGLDLVSQLKIDGVILELQADYTPITHNNKIGRNSK